MVSRPIVRERKSRMGGDAYLAAAQAFILRWGNINKMVCDLAETQIESGRIASIALLQAGYQEAGYKN